MAGEEGKPLGVSLPPSLQRLPLRLPIKSMTLAVMAGLNTFQGSHFPTTQWGIMYFQNYGRHTPTLLGKHSSDRLDRSILLEGT